MRLIDADKLLPKLWVCYEENKPIVDAEPTVEAIPIDWLRMWFTKNGALIGIVLMGEIESDWEKENGRSE